MKNLNSLETFLIFFPVKKMENRLVPSSSIALIVTRSMGMGRLLSQPSTYKEFLKNISALPNRVGEANNSFAWRGINSSIGVNCRFPFASSDNDFAPFSPKVLDGNPSVVTSPIYGAANRRTLLWGRNVLVNSARMNLIPPVPQSTPWRYFTRNSAVVANKYNSVVETFSPLSQMKLWNAMHSSAVEGSLHSELRKMLDFKRLFDGIRYQGKSPNPKPGFGARVADAPAIWSTCLLYGSRSNSNGGVLGEEWKIYPVLLPQQIDFLNTKGGTSASSGHVSISIIAERIGKALDTVSQVRFTRSYEHFCAHVALLLHVRRLIEYWWEPVLNSPSWEKKQAAAGNFLKSWQLYALNLDRIWSLGANDPQVDPVIVAGLDKATNLSISWSQENRRLSDLVRLCTQILTDGDKSIHLNSY